MLGILTHVSYPLKCIGHFVTPTISPMFVSTCVLLNTSDAISVDRTQTAKSY